MSRLGPTGLTQLLTDIKNWVLSKIPTKTSQLTNDSNFLTSHQSLSNYVTLNGTQTISGVKTISAKNVKYTASVTRGTAPSAAVYKQPADYVDSAGNRIFLFETVYNTDKSSKTGLYAYNTTAATGNSIGNISIGCDASGNVYTQAPTPATADNSTKIATTAFVKAQGYITGSGNTTGSAGSCTGNAATATQFSANTTVALTGDATGTSAGSKKGWSVPVTLANSGVTAGSYGPTADVTGNNNATISVPQITVDAKGRVTSVTNRTLTCKNNTYSVYNKTLTIQKNGTNVATFTSNSNTDVTANITVPTKTSELTNDSGFLTSHQSLSNYVTLNGAQTISAVKTFTAWPRIQGTGYPALELKNTAHQVGETPANGSWAFGEVLMKDKDNYSSGLMSLYYTTDKTLYLRIQARNKFTNGVPTVGGTEVGSCIDIGVTNTAVRYIFWNSYVNNNVVPLANATHNLGDTSHKWNAVYAQEYHAYNANAFMANQSGYTFLIRNDGGSTYFLMSAQNGNEGTWTNARPLTIVNSTGICNINGNCDGTAHGLQSSLTQYTDAVTYAEGQLTVGTAAGNAYKGSSNNAALISFPENGTANNTTANVQNLRLAWASDWKYWHDIFVSPNNDYIWHRNVSGGTARGWRRVVEENVSGLTNQTWSINIGGTSANVTGTVAIANGGTGATTRLGAVKALTNENVGTSSQYFITITSSWGKAGYCSVADAKTVLGLSNYVTLADSQTISGKKYFSAAPACKNGGDSQLGATPSNNIANYLEFVDKDGAQSAYIARWHWNNGWSDLFFDVSEKFKNGAKATDGTVQHASFKIGFSPAGVPLAETNGILSTVFLSGDQDPAIKAHMSGTPRGTWNYGVSTIHSGLRSGDNLFNPIGQGYSAGNCAGLVYHHVGSNNNGNYIGIEFFGLGSSFITYRSGLTKTSGKTEYASPADLNNALLNAETTYWGTGTTNKPASSYGTLLTFNREGNVHTSTSNGWLAQLGMGTDARLFLRTKANTGGAWSAWKEFLTSHQSLSNYVTLNGTQTITGTKTFTSDLKFSTTATRGTAPSSNVTARTAYYVDSAGNSIGLIGMYYNTDKSSETRIYAYKTTAATGNNIGHLGIGCDASGNVFTNAPTPAAGDNSTKIATTAFVRSGYVQINTSGYAIGDICLCKFLLKDIGNVSSNVYSITRGKTGIAGSKLLEVTFECSSANEHPIYKTSGSALSGTWVYLGITMSNISSNAANYYPFIALFKRSA